jgi:NitT/TauT family transport system substrate-binding protein
VQPTARSHPRPSRHLAGLLAIVAALAVVGCSSSGASPAPSSSAAGSSTPAAGTAAAGDSVKLGYFPNVTHATAIVGIEKGFFQDALGSTKLETSSFNAGPAASEALLSGAIDATFIGPNPAINAFSKSKGAAIRIVAGATSGGAFLVVKPDIADAAGLKGKKLATPQLGNTQDVALRAWLTSKGLKTDKTGGGDVSILPQENAQTLDTFRAGDIDGAWVPEPWATRLVEEGGGKVLVDEATLWPGGQFVTTHLIVRTDYLTAHPDVIKKLLAGLIKANDFVNASPDEAKTATNTGIEKATKKKLADAVITAAWKNLTFTVDPIASSLQVGLDHAVAAGLTDNVDLKGIYDLGLLNEALAAAGKPAIPQP